MFVVPPGEEAAFVATLDLAAIPGVGPKLLATLARRGLLRVSDALAQDRRALEGWLGVRAGRWLHDRVRGIARGEAVRARTEARSLSRERTFAEDLRREPELETELLDLTARVTADLRDEGLRARTVTVKLRDFDFRTRTAAHTLAQPVATDRAVLPLARELLRRLRRERRVPVRLLGLGLSHLGPGEGPDQLALLPPGDGVETERDRTLARAVDRIQRRYGPEALGPGALLVHRRRDGAAGP